jgi:hypothetical protein
MPALNDSIPEPREGWGVVRPGDRRAHYYRDMDSLCKRVFFYSGPLEPDEMPSPDDCKGCREVLDREARQGPVSAEAMDQMVEDSRAERDL